MSTLFGGGATGAFGTTPAAAAEPKDVEVADPPTDSISSIAFSSAAEYMAVGSWNNEVRVPLCLLKKWYLGL